MTVSIIWSLTQGGSSLADTTVSLGNVSNGQATTDEEIFVRHDGNNSITDVKMYIRAFSGTYSGAASAALDLAEILGWGDQTSADDFGGFMIHMNATGSYPSGEWPDVSTKTTAEGYTCRTGVADSVGNAVTLSAATGAASAGTIASGATNQRFKVRWQVPTNEDTLGIRQWEQILVYNYTS
jgi:hypothetical protein